MIKYGVISTDTLIDDLLHWKTLYVAGRLQKPVTINLFSYLFWNVVNYRDGKLLVVALALTLVICESALKKSPWFRDLVLLEG